MISRRKDDVIGEIAWRLEALGIGTEERLRLLEAIRQAMKESAR